MDHVLGSSGFQGGLRGAQWLESREIFHGAL